MPQVDVELAPAQDGWVADVTVAEDDSRTDHRVTLRAEAYQRLTEGRWPPEACIRASFDFLLEREPKESILREFDLAVISRFFPDYEAEIRKRLTSREP